MRQTLIFLRVQSYRVLVPTSRARSGSCSDRQKSFPLRPTSAVRATSPTPSGRWRAAGQFLDSLSNLTAVVLASWCRLVWWLARLTAARGPRTEPTLQTRLPLKWPILCQVGPMGTAFPSVLRTHYGRHCETFSGPKYFRLFAGSCIGLYSLIIFQGWYLPGPRKRPRCLDPGTNYRLARHAVFPLSCFTKRPLLQTCSISALWPSNSINGSGWMSGLLQPTDRLRGHIQFKGFSSVFKACTWTAVQSSHLHLGVVLRLIKKNDDKGKIYTFFWPFSCCLLYRYRYSGDCSWQHHCIDSITE